MLVLLARALGDIPSAACECPQGFTMAGYSFFIPLPMAVRWFVAFAVSHKKFSIPTSCHHCE